MRLGIYGGSFDPVHYGHLLLAESCREQLTLDQVWFLPAAVPPHKRSRTLADAKHRIEMLRLAIAGHDAFDVSTIEIDRGGVSYTADTLELVAQEQPGAIVYLLMGGESLSELPTWRDPARICRLAVPAVVHRAGGPDVDYSVLDPYVTDERLAEFKQAQVEMPAIELSSTDIRSRISAGQSIRFRTPRAVEKYIETHGLYRGEPAGET